jgi:predicted ArsR family transcriptional regulator
MTDTTIPADTVLAGKASAPSQTPAYRKGSKKARLIELLRPRKGVSVAHLATTLGWQPHTTRAALTGLKKDGVIIEKLAPSRGGTQSRYRLKKD